MHEDVAADFLFDRRTIQLNHASYGSPTKATWDRLTSLRRDLELDPAANLGPHIIARFAEVAQTVREFITLSSGELAFTLNTTEAHQTVVNSIVDSHPNVSAVMRDDEYESVISSWRSSRYRSPNVNVTVTREAGASRSDQADVAVQSVVASSTARKSTTSEVEPRWLRVIDASHVPGHIELSTWTTSAPCPTAIVGSLHKWLPAVRPTGFLWLSDDWPLETHPAIPSLREPTSRIGELLSWRGTWDPTPHLALPVAVEQWIGWERAGLIKQSENLADQASRCMADNGFAECNAQPETAPRMRSFVVADCSAPDLKQLLRNAGINAWVGTHRDNTLLRLSFNVYNDESDIDQLIDALQNRVRHR